MSGLKHVGLAKSYSQTATTFTKRGMWPRRYMNELNGLALASTAGIWTPRVLSAWSNATGGSIVFERCTFPRLDEELWAGRAPDVFALVGQTLGKINNIPFGRMLSLELPERRFGDLTQDVLSRSVIPSPLIAMCSELFRYGCSLLDGKSVGLIHGDFVFQNIFVDDRLMIFDWEHSCSGADKYELGGLLSFGLLPVLDRVWGFTTYLEMTRQILDGYNRVRSMDGDNPAVQIFRFLGHRQVPQYYLTVLEYLAVVRRQPEVAKILAGETTADGARATLAALGIVFDPAWLVKLVKMFQSHEYRTADTLWNWCRRRGVL